MDNLTELPNIGTILAQKLEGIGVSNHEDLAALGSVEAVVRIGETSSSGCYNMLYALEGAIQRVRWHSLPQPIRGELKRQLDAARKN